MRGKTYSDEFKEQILKEVEETGNIVIVARNHSIPYTTIITWIKKEKKSVSAISLRGPKPDNFNSNNHKELEKENNQLKKLLGEKDLEIAILKDLLKKTNRL